MASSGGGRKGKGVENPSPNVSELLQRLNLTEEEEAVADFSDDEGETELPARRWSGHS